MSVPITWFVHYRLEALPYAIITGKFSAPGDNPSDT